MVRRRSTVRFRKGAPSTRQNSPLVDHRVPLGDYPGRRVNGRSRRRSQLLVGTLADRNGPDCSCHDSSPAGVFSSRRGVCRTSSTDHPSSPPGPQLRMSAVVGRTATEPLTASCRPRLSPAVRRWYGQSHRRSPGSASHARCWCPLAQGRAEGLEIQSSYRPYQPRGEEPSWLGRRTAGSRVQPPPSHPRRSAHRIDPTRRLAPLLITCSLLPVSLCPSAADRSLWFKASSGRRP
jgi:hypothetical protein